MGKPGGSHVPSPVHENIMYREGTRGTETSKYPEEKKETSISKVAASEMEVAQTEEHAFRGCGPAYAGDIASRIVLESTVKECKSHVDESEKTAAGTRVPQDTRNPAGSRGAHPPRLKTRW